MIQGTAKSHGPFLRPMRRLRSISNCFMSVLSKNAFLSRNPCFPWLNVFRSSSMPSSFLKPSQSSFDFSRVVSFGFLDEKKPESPPDLTGGGLFKLCKPEEEAAGFGTSRVTLKRNIILISECRASHSLTHLTFSPANSYSSTTLAVSLTGS